MPDLKATIEFNCIEEKCGKPIQFNMMALKESDGFLVCPACHRSYQFNKSTLDKLSKLRNLIVAIREAEEILDDCNIAVTTAVDEVKLPYRLLLTRLNTTFSLYLNDQQVDFTFRVEPLSEEGTFR